MNGLGDVQWESCILEPVQDAEREGLVREALGMAPPMARYYYPSSWITRALVGFDESQVGFEHLGPELNHLIWLVVSRDNSCRYCYAASRIILRLTGVPRRRIYQLENDLVRAELSPRERLLLELARRVSRANPIPNRDELRPLLEAGVTEGLIEEVIFSAAAQVFYNRLATLPAIPTGEMEWMAESWMLLFVRPWMALARWRRPAHREFPDVAWNGPYTYLAGAFRHCRVGVSLAEQLRAAWESPVLARRTKALAFAVVARGLDCGRSEAEAVQVLAEEGLSRAVVDHVLAHLSAPELDPAEGAIVPIARETIWCRPDRIQRRARILREQLTREQLIEAIGILALANAVCRMHGVMALPPS